jgi:hypothetical protein
MDTSQLADASEFQLRRELNLAARRNDMKSWEAIAVALVELWAKEDADARKQEGRADVQGAS